MELSFEVPFPHIKEILPLEDFQFLLAQHIEEYAGHGIDFRKAILDNGMYELGEPLSVWELAPIAVSIRPASVIAPDWMDDASKTLLASRRLKDLLKGSGINVGGVVQGRSFADRLDCCTTMAAEGFSPICFPFRTPRAATIQGLYLRGHLNRVKWYHLLGLQHLSELQWRYPGRWSLDTGKPFKGYRFDKAGNIRGHGRLVLEKKLTCTQMRTALWNIAYMRRLSLGG